MIIISENQPANGMPVNTCLSVGVEFISCPDFYKYLTSNDVLSQLEKCDMTMVIAPKGYTPQL
jgi:hypothetical protein